MTSILVRQMKAAPFNQLLLQIQDASKDSEAPLEGD
jgi:hypothetical protein